MFGVAGAGMVIPTEVILTMSQADFDKFCDAIEAEIARLENIDYASRKAQALSNFEAAIVVQRYAASKNEYSTRTSGHTIGA